MQEKEIFRDARIAMPLPELMRHLGDGVHLPINLGGSRNAECPFCNERGKFSVYEKGDRFYFKCMRASCRACDADSGHTEIGYLALRKGLSGKEASKLFLEIALPDRIRREEERPDKPKAAFRNPARELSERNPWPGRRRRSPGGATAA